MVVQKWLLLLIAVAIDVFIEYPNLMHPTFWVGSVLAKIDKSYLRKGSEIDLAVGTLSSLVTYALAGLLALVGCKALMFYPIGAIIYIFLLKSAFSSGLLIKKVRSCAIDDESLLRARVSEIVSRDVSLSKSFLYSAAIESGAENLVDSVVSPLFYYLIFGLPGALIYRAINTADALIGYRDPTHIKFGKFAAFVDYIANYLPARIFYFITFLVYGKGSFKDIRVKKGLRMNGKYPMLLFSKILKLRLVKKGNYVIGSGRLPEAKDVEKASVYLTLVSYAFIALVVFLSYAFSLPRWC